MIQGLRTVKTPNLSALVLLSLSLAACGGEAPSEQAAEEEPLVPPIFFEDLNVHRVHNFMITQLGTEDAWDRTRYMEFDFIVRRDDGPDFRRSHQWDKWEQKARVEWTQDEEPVVVMLDALSPPTGQAWIGSELVTNAAQADSLVQRA